MNNHLLNLARNDLAAARDNLSRAQRVADRGSIRLNELYGDSGETLDQIIKRYQQWENRARRAVTLAESL